jgi:hypothetical protein
MEVIGPFSAINHDVALPTTREQAEALLRAQRGVEHSSIRTVKNAKEYRAMLKEKFAEKNSWGKNEIMKALDDTYIELLEG